MHAADFKQQMKERLLAEKSRLERDLADIGKRDPAHPNMFEPDHPESGGNSDDDNAIEVSSYADEISIIAKLESELRDTIKALGAIEKGEYGVCKYCGQVIDEKRLEARPASSTCVACKKLLTQEL